MTDTSGTPHDDRGGAAITVDAEQIAEALPRVMAEHGVAIIANVASADDVAALEAAFAAI